MNEVGVGSDTQSAGSIDRRRLLKTAAAAGVGVAVWSTPSITSIGGTPVYAAACTGTTARYDVGYSQTSCNCDNNGVSSIKYTPITSQCGGTAVPLGYAATITDGSGTPLGASGSCAPGTVQNGNNNAGTAHATLTVPSGQFCKLEVFATVGNCGTVIANTTVSTGIVTGPATSSVALPPVSCSGGGNVFFQAVLVCSNDIGCID